MDVQLITDCFFFSRERERERLDPRKALITLNRGQDMVQLTLVKGNGKDVARIKPPQDAAVQNSEMTDVSLY